MRIGRLAERTGVSTKTLRFYEDEGLLPRPARTASGYRDYEPEAADRVGFVRKAQAAGLTLAQIRQVLAVRDSGDAPCHHLAGFVDARLSEVERRLEELAETRRQLLGLRARLDTLEPTECVSDEVCSALSSERLSAGRRDE